MLPTIRARERPGLNTIMSSTSTSNTITAAFLDRFHPKISEAISAGLPDNWTARFAESRAVADQVATIKDADVAFVFAAPMDATLLKEAQRLRLIQKLGAGVDRIDLNTCRERGIAVARLMAGNAIPVAEHTMLLMLAVYRRLPLNDRNTRAGAWDKEHARGVNRQLHGKRIGLVGFGAIGRALAKLLAGFEVEIVYYDPVAAPAEIERDLRVKALPLDEVIATADIVSLHLPLSPATAGLMDAARIARMKPGAVLINAARGGLVDEAALAQALREGRLFGAGIDAFAKEPPVDSPLLALDETVITPHFAGGTFDNFTNVLSRALANAQGYLAGGSLPSTDVVLMPSREHA
jgi:phosphoglycerate dehydrogenase-like enzyme